MIPAWPVGWGVVQSAPLLMTSVILITVAAILITVTPTAVAVKATVRQSRPAIISAEARGSIGEDVSITVRRSPVSVFVTLSS